MVNAVFSGLEGSYICINTIKDRSPDQVRMLAAQNPSFARPDNPYNNLTSLFLDQTLGQNSDSDGRRNYIWAAECLAMSIWIIYIIVIWYHLKRLIKFGDLRFSVCAVERLIQTLDYDNRHVVYVCGPIPRIALNRVVDSRNDLVRYVDSFRMVGDFPKLFVYAFGPKNAAVSWLLLLIHF